MIDKVSNINGWIRTLHIEILILFLSILRVRINCLQLARYGKFKEQQYSQQFEKRFVFLIFNKGLTLSQKRGRYPIVFDPSNVTKSIKEAPVLGRYWSGCANKTKRELEIGGLVAIDIDNHTTFHFESVHALVVYDQSLSGWYAGVISGRKDTLNSTPKYLIADAWFYKKSFADQVISFGMHLASRLRDNVNLRYLCEKVPARKKGRPRKYTGKIDTSYFHRDIFTYISEDEESTIYATKAFIKANVKDTHKIYLSIDISMDPKDVLLYYHSRFQIEFLYRDGKQHTGLGESQDRSENKLYFQFNAFLTSINIAKAIHFD